MAPRLASNWPRHYRQYHRRKINDHGNDASRYSGTPPKAHRRRNRLEHSAEI
jgi:hypothetical protein